MSDTESLSGVFAGMLGELETEETKLIAKQSELAKELADVESELARLANVRAAMMGQPPKRTTTRRKSGANGAQKLGETAQAIMAWAREQSEPWTGGDVARALGKDSRGVGSSLTGLVNHGALIVTDANGKRVYSVAAR